MCGRKSKLLCSLSLALLFWWLPILSVAADRVLTEAQYQQLIANLTSLEKLNAQQQDLLQKQATTLQAQQVTISSLQDSLQKQISLLPQVSQSFDQAVKQAEADSKVWRTAAFAFAGLGVGYAVDGPRGALIGGASGAAVGGVLWLFRL